MKSKVIIFSIIAMLTFSMMLHAQTYFEWKKTIKDAPITWFDSMNYSNAVENADINIEDFRFDEKSNCIKFSFISYNLLAWQPIVWEGGEKVYSPETPKVKVCLFLYSKSRDKWVGGPFTTIPLCIEFAGITDIYDTKKSGWPKLTGKFHKETPLAMCLLKDDGTERSPIIFNF